MSRFDNLIYRGLVVVVCVPIVAAGALFTVKVVKEILRLVS